MNSWNPLTIGELIDSGEASLQTGPFGTQFKASEYVSSGIPMVNVKNIGYGDLRTESLDYLDEKTAHRLRVHRLITGDIVFGRKGSADRHSIIPSSCEGWIQGSDCMRLRLRSGRVNSHFLSYYFCTSGHKYWMEAVCAFGATMSTLNQGIVRRISLRVPPIAVQNKIVTILSAYDALIDNNKKRILLLEKLAEENYREWFVRLRFPDYEHATFTKGIPNGWKRRQISALASEIKRGVKKKDLADDEKYIGLEHIPRRSIAIWDWATGDTVDSNKLLFQERDILFCKIRPYLHKVALAHFSGACSSDTIVIRPKDKLYEGYLLFTVFSDTFVELATVSAKGTKMPRADWDFLKKLEIIVPDEAVLKPYQHNFEAIYSQIVSLLKANELLIASRDMLRPRLLSGNLSVGDLDIQFPPSKTGDLIARPEALIHA
jgi:type I restriction enzyme S subunit